MSVSLFSRSYMSVIERNRLRIKATGEIFTPTLLVEEVLNTLDPSHFENSERTFLDPACGDGQFLASILWRKLENGDRFEEALSTIYGVVHAGANFTYTVGHHPPQSSLLGPI